MFFKKTASAEQFEFAFVIGIGQFFHHNGRMPTPNEIESKVTEVNAGAGLKLTSSQQGALKLAVLLVQSGGFPKKFEQMVLEGKQTDGKTYADIVTTLQHHFVNFAP